MVKITGSQFSPECSFLKVNSLGLRPRSSGLTIEVQMGCEDTELLPWLFDLDLQSFLGIILPPDGALAPPAKPGALTAEADAEANGLNDITEERKDCPGLFPRLFVLRDTELVEDAAAQVTKAGMEARKFCKASTGM